MSATGPTCSGVFFRLHCRHQQVFEKEYKRSNRNRGTKILRCFPHCCPSHVERSYCGSSLELAVEFHQPLQVDAHSLFVFARFETVDLETSLAVGEYCSLRHLQTVSQSETNPEATWVQGVLQTRAASATTRVFLLNGQTSSKWYYHWESGANKARRLTKHLLKAYIMYRRPQHGDGSDRVQVIGAVTSPPFTLVSYRRAAWEGLEGMEGAAYPGEVDTGNEYDLHQVVQDQISQAFQDFQKQTGSAPPQSTQRKAGERLGVGSYLTTDHHHRESIQSLDDDPRADDADRETSNCDNCGHYRRARPTGVNAVLADQWIWERQHTAMMLHMKDLAIIYYFASNVPMTLAMQSFRVREHVYKTLQQLWQSDEPVAQGPSIRRASSVSLRQPAILLSLLFPDSESAAGVSRSGTVSTGGTMTSQMENLLLVVSKLSIWMLARDSIELFQEFFSSHAGVLVQKRSLRDAFMHFAGLVCKQVHVFWSREVKAASSDGAAPRDSAFKALRTMSEHIISLSHSDARFQSMWPDLREILEAPGTIMWESFIAQLRETYSRTQNMDGYPRNRRRPQESSHRSIVKFTGAWVLDASTTTVERRANSVSTASRGVESPSISEALMMMVQLQHLHLRIPSKQILLIRSDSSLLPNANPWMKLVCDGTRRTTGALPFGLSSLIGSQLLGGDYIATMDPSRSRIRIELFWWPLLAGKASTPAVRVAVALLLHSDGSTLQAAVDLQHGALARGQHQHSRERLARIDLWTARERAALCSVWASLALVHVCFTRAVTA